MTDVDSLRYCIAGNFRQEFNFVAFVKAIFFCLTKFFHKATSVGLEIFMNVKVNNKQKSDNRTAEEQTNERRPAFDENKFLKNCLTVAFDKIFRRRKFLLCSIPYVGEEGDEGSSSHGRSKKQNIDCRDISRHQSTCVQMAKARRKPVPC